MAYRGHCQMTSFKNVDLLSRPDYEEFLSVSRCLHISDVEDAQRRRMLVPQPIRNSKALGSNTRVLWFAPTQSMEKHNFYGNVSYVINWKTLLDYMGPHLYLIDQAIYADQAFTRILLTKNNYDVRLQNVNLHSDGSAILKRSNKYHHAARCYCKNRAGHHELQIGIEVTDKDARWIYNRCTVMANNHMSANVPMTRQITRKDGKIKKYAPFKCFLYNTTLNTECPYQDSRSKAEATLASMNIAFSRTLPLDDDMETDKENVNHNNSSYPSHAIGAISINQIKPKTGVVSTLVIETVEPRTSQPSTRPNDGLTVGNSAAFATLSWNIGDQRYPEQSARLRDRLERQSTTTVETNDSSHVDRTVYPPRPNKLPPIAKTIAVPIAGSETSVQRVVRQPGNKRSVATEPAFTWHPSIRAPPSPNPTFGLGGGHSNSSSTRSLSSWSSPVTSPVRNDWSPIVDVARTPHDEPERPGGSVIERLRRLFCGCCCC